MNQSHGTLGCKAIRKNQDATFQPYVLHILPRNHNKELRLLEAGHLDEIDRSKR